MKTPAQRQAKRRENLKKEGMVEIKLIVPSNFREDLKAKAAKRHLTVSELVMGEFGH